MCEMKILNLDTRNSEEGSAKIPSLTKIKAALGKDKPN